MKGNPEVFEAGKSIDFQLKIFIDFQYKITISNI